MMITCHPLIDTSEKKREKREKGRDRLRETMRYREAERQRYKGIEKKRERK
jgi:hypothetical protein